MNHEKQKKQFQKRNQINLKDKKNNHPSLAFLEEIR